MIPDSALHLDARHEPGPSGWRARVLGPKISGLTQLHLSDPELSPPIGHSGMTLYGFSGMNSLPN